MANLKLHTIGIHGGFHHNFLYTVVRTVRWTASIPRWSAAIVRSVYSKHTSQKANAELWMSCHILARLRTPCMDKIRAPYDLIDLKCTMK